jgi:lipopolysaccharide assembly outer membrane protein LptD (OstA)
VRAALKEKADVAKETAKSQLSQFGNIVSKDARFSGRDARSGNLVWEVGAKVARTVEATKDASGRATPEAIKLEGARATLFNAEGKPESSFEAPHIQLVGPSSKSPILKLTGGVKMRTLGSQLAQSERLKQLTARGTIELSSPELRIDVKARRLFAGRGGQMKQGATVVNAKILNADSGLATVRLSGGVVVTSSEGKAAGRAEAKNAVWKWGSGRITATDDIRVTRDGTTITGARLEADTNANNGRLMDGVKVLSGDGVATASYVTYDWKRGRIEGIGGVRLQKDGATLSAARIQTDTKLNAASATGGVTLVRDGTTVRASQVNGFDKLSRVIANGGVTLLRDGTTVRASRVEAWLDENRAQAVGGVTLVQDDLSVRGSFVQVNNFNDESKRRVSASGTVTARNGQGEVRASQIEWGGGRIVATGGVSLLMKGNRLTGARVESDDQFRAATLTGSVNARLAQGGVVTAQAVQWRAGKGEAPRDGRFTAKNGVTAHYEKLTLRTDTLEVAGDGKTALASGNVTITNSDGATARAPRARYSQRDGKIYAEGGATFKDPRRGLELHGKTLVYDIKSQQANMNGVSGSGKMDVLDGKKLF